MPAYVIFIREQTHDPAELEAYAKAAGPALEGGPASVQGGDVSRVDRRRTAGRQRQEWPAAGAPSQLKPVSLASALPEALGLAERLQRRGGIANECCAARGEPAERERAMYRCV